MKLRRSVVMILIAAMAMAVAAPSAAKDMFMSKTSGRNAVANWTQFDGEPSGSPFGNVHIGSLYVYETTSGSADAFVWIDDFECPAGVHPWEDYEGECSFVGVREGWAQGADFAIDKRLTAARLTGTFEMQAYALDETDPEGELVPVPIDDPQPFADVTWSGYGDLAKTRSTYRWSDGTTSYSGQYQATERSAVVAGTIGDMGFNPDDTHGWLSNFKDMSKSRTK